MTPSKTQQLLSDFPTLFNLFRNKFECSDGWYSLVYQMAKELSQLTGISVIQVKEKFARLTVYVEPVDNAVAQDVITKAYEIIGRYSTYSKTICEICGTDKEVKTWNDTYWIRTLCSDCHTKLKETPQYGWHNPLI